MKDQEFDIIRGSGNVYGDFGDANPRTESSASKDRLHPCMSPMMSKRRF